MSLLDTNSYSTEALKATCGSPPAICASEGCMDETRAATSGLVPKK